MGDPGSLPSPPPLPDPGALEDPAIKYRTERTRNYPCPQCGGQLGFHPRTQGLRCSSCGHEVAIELAPTAVMKHDLVSTLGELRSLIAQRGPSGGAAGQDLEREIVCQACGGHTSFTGSMTAIRCPYCNTPIQRDDLQAAPLRLPVDGVLPFTVDEDTARTQIEKWINGRWFAPNEFKKYRELGSFTSIYLTYYSYDVATTTDYRGQRGRTYTVTVGSGENRRTETRVDWTPAWGRVHNRFADLTGPANTGLDTAKVTALEPWPMQQLRGYDQRFVSGHLARTYDADADQVYEQSVRGPVESEIDRTIRRDIGGDQQRISSRDIHYDHLAFAQLLLPVWLLTVTYASRPFQVFINGTTGEVQGQRPYSAAKIAALVVGIVLALIVVFVLYSLFGG